MSDNKVKKTYLVFDEDGNIYFNCYSPFGQREEKMLDPNDFDNVTKYLEYLLNSGFRKLVDKYTFPFYK